MDFLELARERFSCRKFNEKQVEPEKIEKIIQTALLAPTALNKQPFKIFRINTVENIEKLKRTTPFTYGAKEFLIVGAYEKGAYVRNFDNKNFAQIDASIVATHMMLEIQDLGLGTVWVGHFDEKILKSEFPVLNEYSIVAIFPIGYPADNVEISAFHYNSKSKEEILKTIE